jgi:thiol-disulfide isomerase/thioredoxin
MNGSGRVVLVDQFGADSAHAVVVSFAASYCIPCRAELPVLQAAADSLASQGLRLVVVMAEADWGAAQESFVSKVGLHVPVVSDKLGLLSRRYGTNGQLPFTVGIGRDGVVRWVRQGFKVSEAEQLRQAVSALLQ